MLFYAKTCLYIILKYCRFTNMIFWDIVDVSTHETNSVEELVHVGPPKYFIRNP